MISEVHELVSSEKEKQSVPRAQLKPETAALSKCAGLKATSLIVIEPKCYQRDVFLNSQNLQQADCHQANEGQEL